MLTTKIKYDWRTLKSLPVNFRVDNLDTLQNNITDN